MLVLIYSCKPKSIYEKNIDIPDGVWNMDNILSFETEINDTINSYSIFINLRHTSLYPYSNIFLFINTTAPSGASIRDTFECRLANEKGHWYGDGLGDIWDVNIPFKKNVRFPMPGIYRFEIEQAMRKKNLPFILDCGLSIEHFENQ